MLRGKCKRGIRGPRCLNYRNGLFAYVSYVHKSWRSLAALNVFHHYRRQAQRLATAIFLLAGIGSLLGWAWRLAHAAPSSDGRRVRATSPMAGRKMTCLTIRSDNLMYGS